tara:strand:+ start:1096 stop:2061 length:966 start_codon:yes stop_codon:yes gene_type:complete
MLDVYITIDTEIWCGDWNNVDASFPEAFRKYIYGPTKQGDYALPATLSILQEHGLEGVFFVEPLFSARFGIGALEEIVGLIRDKDQEIQLHLHSEWINEARPSLLEEVISKTPLLTLLNEDQQFKLIQWGLQRLEDAGGGRANAFRAGSYGANRATLKALKRNGILFDTSYNLDAINGVHDLSPDELLVQPKTEEGVCIYPVSVYRTGDGKGYRNVQITALSYPELVRYLEFAHDSGWDSVVIVSHNFELLSPDKSSVDEIVARRFVKLCHYLDKNRDRYQVKGFKKSLVKDCVQPIPPKTRIDQVGLRYIEQFLRKIKYA